MAFRLFHTYTTQQATSPYTDTRYSCPQDRTFTYTRSSACLQHRRQQLHPHRQTSITYDALGAAEPLSGGATNAYTYAGNAYANPHAVSQTANGVFDHHIRVRTTTGILRVHSVTGLASSTYTYDYANRLIGLFAGGATTTYGYDHSAPVSAQVLTTTFYLSIQLYSIASIGQVWSQDMHDNGIRVQR